MNHEGLQHERRIAVLGGGIAGLAAAYRLCQREPTARVVLFEATGQLGRALCTEAADGFTIEHGADMFLADASTPWALELARELGLADELIGTRQEHRGARIVHNGQLLAVPAGFQLAGPAKVWPVLRSPILSWPAKLRLARERFVSARPELAEEESVADFITRRLGRETYERLVEPLAAGIFTADGTRLSAPAALPQFVEMERQHGSLTKGLALRARVAQADGRAAGARYGKFLAPRKGMGRLAEALAAALPAEVVRLNSAVESIARQGESWQVLPAGGPEERFDGVVIALPAHHAAEMLGAVDMALASELASIEYASSAVVSLGYRTEQLSRMPACFGFVVPAIERRPIVAGSFASTKFEQRAPAGHALVRVFLGGALRPEVVDLPEEELIHTAQSQLAELIGAEGTPVLTRVTRWKRGMPQYHVGHLGRLERIEARAAALPGLALAGAGYRGVGVPQCIRSGQQAAEQVLQELAKQAAAKLAPQLNSEKQS